MVRKSRKSDYFLALAVFALVIFGIIMISSSSVVLSYDRFGINNYYLLRHIISVGIGLAALVVFSVINFRFWKKVSNILILLVIGSLVAVLLFGLNLGGAKSWLDFGLFTIQPTEFVKLFYVLYLASWLEGRSKDLKNFRYGFWPFLVMSGFIGFLIMLQPDTGTASVILFSAASMFVVAGASYQQIIFGGIGVLALGWFLVKSSAYRFARLTVFLDPSSDPQGIGYHINQALLAIGSGGLAGLGFGMSRQKYHYLPEPMGDSIFAIISEELGFIRTTLIIILFAFIILRGFKIARNAPDTFSRLAAFGITSWLAFQTIVNIGAMLSIMPLTGIPLPFVSYGGNALVASMAGIGILLNISKESNYEKTDQSSYRSRGHRRSYSAGTYSRRTVTGRR